MIEKKAKTSVEINELIARRWSPRAFAPKKQVSHNDIISLCEAARWAPSSGGDEPWKFIILDKFTNQVAWNNAFECLEHYNQVWVKNVPVFIIAIADSKWTKDRSSDNRWGEFDSGAASQNIYLQAFSLGLIAHPMGGFDINKIRTTFHIPSEFTPMAVICIGYPDELSVLDDFNQKREIKERKRKDLKDNFFDSDWGSGIV